ncbi:hypothetical protein [Neobacillus cucumis]|uniref:hypothetical protein n=1 Tax=Neobacillus cucumis TaxID=1740721 RepID=UPI0019655533|nr:hypothetical protein [Neobacillus cucumis]MBM7651193.1 hypothetical protein [Neobacillus cucumis]
MLYKTAQVEMGKEAEIQNYLNNLDLKNESHTLSDGTTVIDIEVPTDSIVEEIEKLKGVKKVKDTVFSSGS